MWSLRTRRQKGHLDDSWVTVGRLFGNVLGDFWATFGRLSCSLSGDILFKFLYSFNGVTRSFLKYEVFFTKCCIWPLRFCTIMHLFLYFYSSLLWCWNDCSLIAASAELMVCALPPCSTQNVNHIRNHRAFCDLNIPSEKLEIIACYNNKDPRFSKNHFTRKKKLLWVCLFGVTS